jgi:hypothetical protein
MSQWLDTVKMTAVMTMPDPSADQMICEHCNQPIDDEREKFAVLYDDNDGPIQVVGFLHMRCSKELELSGQADTVTMH